MIQVTPSLLAAAVKGCLLSTATDLAPLLQAYAPTFGLDTKQRLAHFLAQCGHESSGFQVKVESFNYSAERLREVFSRERISDEDCQRYGRTDDHPADQVRLANLLYGGVWGARNLGNTQEGDGWNYRGRGFLQVTGRGNAVKTTATLRNLSIPCPDFEAEPARLEEHKWALLASLAWWYANGCNQLADTGDVSLLTRRINGGQVGLEDRKDRTSHALTAVASWPVEEPPTPESESQVPPWPFGNGEGEPTTGPSPITADPAVVQPIEDKPMAPAFLWGLAKTVIGLFAPLAQEKIEKEIGRHTDNPQVVSQISTAVLGKLQEVTKTTDPIQAVAAVTGPTPQPELIRVVEQATLVKLQELAPFFELLHKQDMESRAADELSRDDAARRASGESWDMSRMLVIGAFGMIGGLALFVCVIAIIQAWRGDIKPEVWAQVAGLIGFATGVGTTIYAYRFGTSRSSAAKDVMIREIARRGNSREL